MDFMLVSELDLRVISASSQTDKCFREAIWHSVHCTETRESADLAISNPPCVSPFEL
jgi:hypothetical protein